jgi:hypothetical protein
MIWRLPSDDDASSVTDSGYAVPDSHRPKQGWRPPNRRPMGEMGPVAHEGGRPRPAEFPKRENWGSAAFGHAVPEALCVKGFAVSAHSGRGWHPMMML